MTILVVRAIKLHLRHFGCESCKMTHFRCRWYFNHYSGSESCCKELCVSKSMFFISIFQSVFQFTLQLSERQRLNGISIPGIVKNDFCFLLWIKWVRMTVVLVIETNLFAIKLINVTPLTAHTLKTFLQSYFFARS